MSQSAEAKRGLPDGWRGFVTELFFPKDPLAQIEVAQKLSKKLDSLEVVDAARFGDLVRLASGQLQELYVAPVSGSIWAIFGRESEAEEVVKPVVYPSRLLENIFGGCNNPEEARGAIQAYAQRLESPGEAVMRWVNGNLVFSSTRWKVWNVLAHKVQSGGGVVDKLQPMVEYAKKTGRVSVLDIDNEWRRAYNSLFGTMRTVVWG